MRATRPTRYGCARPPHLTAGRLTEMLESVETMTELYDEGWHLPPAAPRPVARLRGTLRTLLAVK
jgi:hypothetical protein